MLCICAKRQDPEACKCFMVKKIQAGSGTYSFDFVYVLSWALCCVVATFEICLLYVLIFILLSFLFLCLPLVRHMSCSHTWGLFSLSVARLSVPPVLIFKTQRESFSHFCSHQFPALYPSSSSFSLVYKIGPFSPYFHSCLPPSPPPCLPPASLCHT